MRVVTLSVCLGTHVHDSCFYRPKDPYASWMSDAAEGKVEPVQPTQQELAALKKVRACACVCVCL